MVDNVAWGRYAVFSNVASAEKAFESKSLLPATYETSLRRQAYRVFGPNEYDPDLSHVMSGIRRRGANRAAHPGYVELSLNPRYRQAEKELQDYISSYDPNEVYGWQGGWRKDTEREGEYCFVFVWFVM